MSESKRVILRVAAFACFVLGLMLFLFETRSTGEAPQTFKLMVSSNPLAIVGAAVAAIAVTALVVLYLWERKRHLEHM
jgi:ABC-type xylose transport system permease subunit